MVKLIVDEGQVNSLNTVQQDNVQQDNVPQAIMITVYLAYAEDVQCQHYLTLSVADGTTLYEALKQAGWLMQFEGLARWCDEVVDVAVPTAKRWHVGVYAQKQPLSYQLQPLDRIEVYRSLSADPMSQRKSKSRV
ncbi:conserved hypothetical protein [Psychrobacter arcticus 273-4]|uniref:UPF0125 protein Psyc_0263 n=1 Tax=Psychrobacter arcticus (strain DSM 17307 / VKM B-2377 / 273-4) TaxID=259536 RepID=Q4FV25_PSYA2|nr:RnfH family protein [Psychrobacter arcticus]AAZ18133.1 conserved hypothetical protein [Psychrobacter arcticus 273-4]